MREVRSSGTWREGLEPAIGALHRSSSEIAPPSPRAPPSPSVKWAEYCLPQWLTLWGLNGAGTEGAWHSMALRQVSVLRV